MTVITKTVVEALTTLGTDNTAKLKKIRLYNYPECHGQSDDTEKIVQALEGLKLIKFDKSIKDQPITTLLMAAALGFVIGAIWKS